MSRLPTRKFEMIKGEELQDLIAFCKVMAESPFYRKLGAGGVMSIVLTAKELNLPMMPCLNNGMYNIEGAVSLSAQLMNALIIMEGHKVDLVELTAKRCVINFKRKESEKWKQFVYTIEDAKIAGYLTKNNWRNNPKDMLYCRCLSGGARKFMPDALMGCYIHGELEGGLMPLNESVPEAPEPSEVENQEVEQITFQKSPNYDDFLKGLNPNKKKYIEMVAKESTKTKDEIINHASENETSFESAYQKWLVANDYADSSSLEVQEEDYYQETQG